MYTSIVVPLDGSAFGKRALPVALALARRSNAAVHLVHVHEPGVYPWGWSEYDTSLRDELREEMRTDLTALAAQLTREASLPVDAEFLDGAVVPTLQRHLAERRPDVVVMMTHGRSGPSHAWLGSVADGLVRHSPVPVLLVRSGAEWPNNLAEPLFRRVLIPLDGSTMAEEVLEHVVALGTPAATVYTLLTVIVPLPLLAHSYPTSESFIDRSGIERQREEAAAYLSRTAEKLSKSGARAEVRVVGNQGPAHGILDEAEAQHVDLIALSTHGHGGLARLLLGSVADKVVRGATVPMLIYRTERARADSPELGSAGSTAASRASARASGVVAGSSQRPGKR